MAAKLRIKLTERLGFAPPALGYLANISHITDGYRAYRLRHPGGIFNLQVGDFSKELLGLARLARRYESSGEMFADRDELGRRLISTLFAFTNYFNAGYDIILGCCDRKASAPNREVWKWLKENNYKAEGFYKSSLSEASFFLNIFNELKHTSKRFGTVVLRRVSDGVNIAGYYLEAIDEGGAIVPDTKYHGSSPSANSFNLDLRKLYYLLYRIADSLTAALRVHFKQVYAVELGFNAEHTADDKILSELYEEMRLLPMAFLPNETGRVPVARVSGKEGNRSLVFENERVPHLPTSMIYEVRTMFPPADGFSRSFGIPYFRQ